MLKRFWLWLTTPTPVIVDPNEYPEIIPDLSVEEIMRRLDIIDDEDNTANFYMEVEEMND